MTQKAKTTQIMLLLVAVVTMTASSLFFHETGNRLLTMGYLFGLPVHARALSCLANIIGITAGFAIAAFQFERFSKVCRSQPFWIGFFAVQELLVVVFYPTFHPLGDCEWTLVLQFFSGLSLAVFLTACMGFARFCSFAQFRTLIAVSVLLTVATTYGIMSMVAQTLPLLASLLTQVVLMAIGGVCYILVVRFGPVSPRVRGSSGTSGTSGVSGSSGTSGASGTSSSSGTSNSSNSSGGLPEEAPFSGVASHPLVYLAIILVSYGLVFGFLHVIPLGLPTFQLPRVLPNLIGAVVAMVLFVVTVPKSEPSPSLIWNRIYRISFPFVTLAALLVPYTSSNEFVSSLSFVESAQFFFIALIVTGCYVVCRTVGVSCMQVLSFAMLMYNAGFLVGDQIAAVVHDVVPLNDSTFGLMGIAVFLLLTVVTFNTNGEQYAKTAWGILPKESPKALYEERIVRRCEELADTYGLTARERETLLLLAQGKRPKEISEIRTVSITTVRSQVQGIYSKLGVHSADELNHLIRKKG